MSEKFNREQYLLESTAWHYRILQGDLWKPEVYQQYWRWKEKVDAYMRAITEERPGAAGQGGAR